MATKQTKEEQQLKTIISAIKATVNKSTLLPILETVHLHEDGLTVSDLETSVTMPFQSGIDACLPASMFYNVHELMKQPAFSCEVHIAPNGSKDYAIEASEGKRKVKMMGDNPDNFPLNGMEGKYAPDFMEIGRFTQEDMENLSTALQFVSNDDLRPAMTGILVGDQIAATDAHRLFFRNTSEEFMEHFIIPAKTVKIMRVFGGEWQVFMGIKYITDMKGHNDRDFVLVDGIVHRRHGYCKVKEFEELSAIYNEVMGFTPSDELSANELVDLMKEHDATTEDKPFLTREAYQEDLLVPETYSHHVALLNEDGVLIVFRPIDAKFPDYKVVIPDSKPTITMQSDVVTIRREMKNAVKFANQSTNQVVFDLNGSISVQSQDVDFAHQYDYEFEQSEATYQGKLEEGEHFQIAFNGKFIDHVASVLPKDAPIRFNFWSPTKATVINDSFLIMPLMLNV